MNASLRSAVIAGGVEPAVAAGTASLVHRGSGRGETEVPRRGEPEASMGRELQAPADSATPVGCSGVKAGDGIMKNSPKRCPGAALFKQAVELPPAAVRLLRGKTIWSTHARRAGGAAWQPRVASCSEVSGCLPYRTSYYLRRYGPRCSGGLCVVDRRRPEMDDDHTPNCPAATTSSRLDPSTDRVRPECVLCQR